MPISGLLLAFLLLCESCRCCGATVLTYVPLDERFATRGLFLGLAQLLDLEVRTPPLSMISQLHRPANLSALDGWLDDSLAQSDYAIVSAEMFVYGGLIASRESNQTVVEVHERAAALASLKQRFAQLRGVFVSSVVMRIPSYNGTFEEPWYGYWGKDIYEWSFHSSRFDAMGDPEDQVVANAARSRIPPNAVGEFEWRRERNHRATLDLLRAYGGAQSGGADAFLVTIDDAAEYGFNVDEAAEVKSVAEAEGLLNSVVRVYPGADEVASTLLARLVIDAHSGASLCAKVVWRIPDNILAIPNYESQSINATVHDQLAAAGLSPTCGSGARQVVLVVNNFDAQEQLESSAQPAMPNLSDFAPLEDVVQSCDPSSQVLAFADSRYSNGGDLGLVAWLEARIGTSSPCLARGAFAYAGWNTNGNTLGTAIGNGALLALAGPSEASARFTLLRLTEDLAYQSDVRALLTSFVERAGDSISQLDSDLHFYEKYAAKALRTATTRFARALGGPYNTTLRRAWFPWNRTFEVGLELSEPEERRLSSRPDAALQRASWLPVSYMSDSAESMRRVLSDLKKTGVRVVYVDVWNNGRVFFESATMDAAVGAAGMARDSLRWALEAAGELDLEIYAWFEYGLMSSYGSDTNAFAAYAKERRWDIGSYPTGGHNWMDPANEEVLAFLAGLMRDCLEGYTALGLRGLQLDDHFASPTALGGDADVMTAAAAYIRRALPNNTFLSLSPGTLDQARTTYSVDWNQWLERDLFDAVIPQIYRPDFRNFKTEYDLTARRLSAQALEVWARPMSAVGVRCDGTGASTAWTELNNQLNYATADGRGLAVWYARGVLETYPTEFAGLWTDESSLAKGSTAVTDCDILIAGGSLAALGAAVTAANLSLAAAARSGDEPSRVCLLEPTEWPGGQLTAAATPPDFGATNRAERFLPASFVRLIRSVVGADVDWDRAESNPGRCWVSTHCIDFSAAAANAIELLNSFSASLRVYYNTVVKATKVEHGRITQLTAVARRRVGAATPTETYSSALRDWYSTSDSDKFEKNVLVFDGARVVVEATELGDVLGTSGLEYHQGVEVPHEHSDSVDRGCGQAITFPFVMAYCGGDRGGGCAGEDVLTPADVPKPADLDFDLGDLSWSRAWTYRRVHAAGKLRYAVHPRDLSSQNYDNDLTTAYWAAAPSGGGGDDWAGGVDFEALAAAERRSFGWFHFLLAANNPLPAAADQLLAMNRTIVGTAHGLSRVPYLRDGRRPVRGIGDFRLTYDMLRSGGFDDAVGLGDYHYADIHRLDRAACPNGYPSYIFTDDGENRPLGTYDLPYRALTHRDSPNLLVVGRNMAASLLASAGLRLHPSEYASGCAAGAAAALLVGSDAPANTSHLYDAIDAEGRRPYVLRLQALLASDSVRSPTSWDDLIEATDDETNTSDERETRAADDATTKTALTAETTRNESEAYSL